MLVEVVILVLAGVVILVLAEVVIPAALAEVVAVNTRDGKPSGKSTSLMNTKSAQ